MIFLRNARQGGARLALPAGRDDEQFAARQTHRGVEIHRLWKIEQIAIVLRHRDDAVERAPGNADLAPRLARDFAQRVQARHIAGEGRHEHALALVTRNLIHQTAMDGPLRSARIGIEDVGAVANESEDALFANGAQVFFAGRFADDGVFVQLPVAGVEDAALRRLDQESVTLGDRMGERDIGNVERADGKFAVIVLDHIHLDFTGDARFLQFAAHEFGSEGCGIDRDAQIGCEIGDRTDMILVPVSNHQSFEAVQPVLDEFEIGEDEIDAGILLTRKGHAEIDHEPPPLAAIEIDVHPDLAGPAKREKQQFVFGRVILFHNASFQVAPVRARSARIARPSKVKSLSTASNRSVCSSNSRASPPVATVFAGRPISLLIRATSPSISET